MRIGLAGWIVASSLLGATADAAHGASASALQAGQVATVVVQLVDMAF